METAVSTDGSSLSLQGETFESKRLQYEKTLDRLLTKAARQNKPLTLKAAQQSASDFLEQRKIDSLEKLNLCLRRRLVEHFISEVPSRSTLPTIAMIAETNPELSSNLKKYFYQGNHTVHESALSYLYGLIHAATKKLQETPSIEAINSVLSSRDLPLLRSLANLTGPTIAFIEKAARSALKGEVFNQGTPVWRNIKDATISQIITLLEESNDSKRGLSKENFANLSMTQFIRAHPHLTYETYNYEMEEAFGGWPQALDAAYAEYISNRNG